jgi:hypothetical protein
MHLGDTAEDEKGDAADRHTETLCHSRMGHFVEDDREQETYGRHDRHRPIGRRGQPRNDAGEDANRQIPRDEHREKEPRRVNINVKSK